jgi:hypothetical protein
MSKHTNQNLPDPGRCDCGQSGSWDHPMFGYSRDTPVYWPTCPIHRDHATGVPVTRDELKKS